MVGTRLFLSREKRTFCVLMCSEKRNENHTLSAGKALEKPQLSQ